MNLLESILINCPYCGEALEILVDRSEGRQQTIEDCAVCCRPITLIIDCDAEAISLEARRDDEC